MKRIFLAVATITLCIASARGQIEEIESLQPGVLLFNLFDQKTGKSYLKYTKVNNGTDPSVDKYNLIDWLSSGKNEEFWGLTASPEAGKVFWNDFKQEVIYEFGIEKQQFQRIAKFMTAGLQNLAYDHITSVLYWTDTRMRTIFAIDKTRNYVTRIQDTEQLEPHAITIHVKRRKIIYSKFLMTIPTIAQAQIVKCNLDGGKAETIVRFPDIVQVVGLTVDHENERLFWVDHALSGNNVVQSTDLNGNSRELVYSSITSAFADLAVFQNRIFVTDGAKKKSRYNIHILSQLTFDSEKTLRTKNVPRNVEAFALKESSSSNILNECENTNCNHVCVASSKGKSKCKCHQGYKLTSNELCETESIEEDRFIVFDIGYNRLYQVGLSGTTTKQDAPMAYPIPDAEHRQISAFAVDEVNNNIVIYNAKKKVFLWEEFLLKFAAGKVLYMRTDSCNKLLYWNTATAIYRWKADEQLATELYKVASDDNKIRRFDLDLKRGNVFWTEYDKTSNLGLVKTARTSGEGVKTLYESQEPLNAITLNQKKNRLIFATMTTGLLTSMSLKNLRGRKRRGSDFVTENLVDYVDGITSIQDIMVVEEYLYLIDRQWSALLRLVWEDGIQSIQRFGPNRFLNPTKFGIMMVKGNSQCKKLPPTRAAITTPPRFVVGTFPPARFPRTTTAETTTETTTATTTEEKTSTTRTVTTERTRATIGFFFPTFRIPTRPATTTVESTKPPVPDFPSTILDSIGIPDGHPCSAFRDFNFQGSDSIRQALELCIRFSNLGR